MPKPVDTLRIKKVIVDRYGEPVTRYKVYLGRERVGNYMGYKEKKDALAVGRFVENKEKGEKPKSFFKKKKFFK